MASRKLTMSIAAAAAAIAIGGGSYAIVSASSGSALASAPTSASSSPRTGDGASNARSGPAAGGTEGTVSSLSSSGFTLTTSAGQKVTITEAPATTYHEGPSPASASAIADGDPVLVLGTAENTTIAATQVIVHPAAPAAATAAQVVPFHRGAASTSKQARSRRATGRDQGQSSAERPPARQPKRHWPPTPVASSTAWCS